MDSMVSVNGKSGIDTVDSYIQSVVAGHYLIAAALIIVLAVVVIMFMYKSKEGYMPTSTIRMQQRDGLGENLDETSTAPDMSASPTTILSSWGCKSGKVAEADAWGWMSGALQSDVAAGLTSAEGLAVRPKSDNDFSKILSGH
jgi:hypothetical protein